MPAAPIHSSDSRGEGLTIVVRTTGNNSDICSYHGRIGAFSGEQICS